MSVAKPSEFRLIPARVGLNAVAALRRRNLQTGTAILNRGFAIISMMKNFLFIAFILTALFGAACSGESAPNGNSNSASSSNTSTNVPPEFRDVNVPPSGNSTPGIPPANQANVNLKPDSNGMIAPGIPAANKINKPVTKGATPTPGIPDPATLKKQANTLIKDANVVNQAPKTMKDAEKQIKDGVKTVRKP